MKIAIGADWVAIDHKQAVIDHLKAHGHTVLNMGSDSNEMNDYPDFAEKVAKSISDGDAEVGVLFCGTGIGMSIAANKIPGIRAALCHDAFTTVRSRGHNDANVLVMGAWVVSIPHALELIDLWLQTPYDAGRHVPRLEKIKKLEEK